jgi:ribosome-associated protein
VAKTKTKTKAKVATKRVKPVAAKKAVAKKVIAKKAIAKKAATKKAIKKSTPRTKKAVLSNSPLLTRILAALDADKAENIVTVDLRGRSALCDAAVIASGRSSRHVAAMADHLGRRLKEAGYGTCPINGATQGDWVLVDAGDVIVHLFRPEVRDYYDLEGMWSVGARP